MKMKSALGLLFGILLLYGCSSAPEEPQRACTLIGCDDGLNVQVQSSLMQAFTITVRSSGGAVLHTFSCEPGRPCQAFVAGQTPEEVIVTLTSAEGPVSKTYRPEYRLTRPNGPDCPPECKQATIVMTVS